ncbi:dihydrofolate reductase family protein [Algoriphagus sediminis]|uniref:Dihydrofolate reductase family protein n=1 Tax=Algoriphagus sediminis TaxID=3057113 RepID=A0ABT7Y907_9BACT|nr:dihydrofolate reductase family protein [Algoriphagus sediminis]MDN3203002.1 dihydrofolate reductase family protein [Algoriphagus sediminis]
MAQIKLYIAISLDGFIARKNGDIDWLENLPNPNKLDYGYGEFIDGIDTVIMGRSTYEKILSFGIDWPYSEYESFIFTRKAGYLTKTTRTQALALSQQNIELIKSKSQKSVWLVGGGEIITELLNMDEIDEMIICIIPTIIGNGIPLFPNHPKETQFELVNTKPFDTGAVILTYKRKV